MEINSFLRLTRDILQITGSVQKPMVLTQDPLHSGLELEVWILWFLWFSRMFYGIFMVFLWYLFMLLEGPVSKPMVLTQGDSFPRVPPYLEQALKEIMDFSCSTLARGPEVRGDPWFLIRFCELLETSCKSVGLCKNQWF